MGLFSSKKIVSGLSSAQVSSMAKRLGVSGGSVSGQRKALEGELNVSSADKAGKILRSAGYDETARAKIIGGAEQAKPVRLSEISERIKDREIGEMAIDIAHNNSNFKVKQALLKKRLDQFDLKGQKLGNEDRKTLIKRVEVKAKEIIKRNIEGTKALDTGGIESIGKSGTNVAERNSRGRSSAARVGSGPVRLASSQQGFGGSQSSHSAPAASFSQERQASHPVSNPLLRPDLPVTDSPASDPMDRGNDYNQSNNF